MFFNLWYKKYFNLTWYWMSICFFFQVSWIRVNVLHFACIIVWIRNVDIFYSQRSLSIRVLFYVSLWNYYSSLTVKHLIIIIVVQLSQTCNFFSSHWKLYYRPNLARWLSVKHLGGKRLVLINYWGKTFARKSLLLRFQNKNNELTRIKKIVINIVRVCIRLFKDKLIELLKKLWDLYRRWQPWDRLSVLYGGYATWDGFIVLVSPLVLDVVRVTCQQVNASGRETRHLHICTSEHVHHIIWNILIEQYHATILYS